MQRQLGERDTDRWLASSIWFEAVQQAAEEIHEADREVDISCGDHLAAVAPYEGYAGVHQPLKKRVNLHAAIITTHCHPRH